MRRVFSAFILCLLFIVALSLSACNSQPQGMEKDNYNVSCNILNTLNSYLSGNLNGSEASSKLQDLAGRLDPTADKNQDSITIMNDAEDAAIELAGSDVLGADLDKIKSYRDDVKKILHK